MRSETRYNIDTLEMLDLKIRNNSINAVVSDQSSSGFGLFTKPTALLAKGCIVTINNIIYKVCWLVKISKNIMTFGVCLA